MTTDKTDLKRIVVFRTTDLDELADRFDDSQILYKELKAGRLHQGWGARELALQDAHGKTVSKQKWEQAYRDIGWGDPSKRRYSALTPLLKIVEGDIVVLPKQPEYNQFSIARVTGQYRLDVDNLIDGDWGHVIPVDPDSVRTFNYRADEYAFTVSSLFSRANHRYPVTFADSKSHIDAAEHLLENPDNRDAHEDIAAAALADATKAAAQKMLDEVQKWNGKSFQKIVEMVFENQGYTVVTKYRSYDRKGGDVDIVVSPPHSNHGLFMPQEIAVQVKWKKGIDQNDIKAVDQLIEWQESDTVTKFVISSADNFTDACKKKAEAEGITLIGGLNAMYFLMGIDRMDDSD